MIHQKIRYSISECETYVYTKHEIGNDKYDIFEFTHSQYNLLGKFRQTRRWNPYYGTTESRILKNG